MEQTGLTDQPALPDVAEGLDIPVEEVQRLLAEVRAQRLEEEAGLARERKLARAMRRLAEEEARLAEVQQQRATTRLTKAERRGRSAEDEAVPWEVWKATHAPAQWVETTPNIWEDATTPGSETDQYKCSPPTRPRAVRMAKALAKIVYCLLILGLAIGPIVYVFVMFLYMMLH